jgi:hypothetical protein
VQILLKNATNCILLYQQFLENLLTSAISTALGYNLDRNYYMENQRFINDLNSKKLAFIDYFHGQPLIEGIPSNIAALEIIDHSSLKTIIDYTKESQSFFIDFYKFKNKATNSTRNIIAHKGQGLSWGEFYRDFPYIKTQIDNLNKLFKYFQYENPYLQYMNIINRLV